MDLKDSFLAMDLSFQIISPSQNGSQPTLFNWKKGVLGAYCCPVRVSHRSFWGLKLLISAFHGPLHWLSSPIFPCSLFVRPAMVTSFPSSPPPPPHSFFCFSSSFYIFGRPRYPRFPRHPVKPFTPVTPVIMQ